MFLLFLCFQEKMRGKDSFDLPSSCEFFFVFLTPYRFCCPECAADRRRGGGVGRTRAEGERGRIGYARGRDVQSIHCSLQQQKAANIFNSSSQTLKNLCLVECSLFVVLKNVKTFVSTPLFHWIFYFLIWRAFRRRMAHAVGGARGRRARVCILRNHDDG